MVKSESQIGTVCGPLTNQEVHVEVCQRTHHFRIPNIENMNNEHLIFFYYYYTCIKGYRRRALPVLYSLPLF